MRSSRLSFFQKKLDENGGIWKLAHRWVKLQKRGKSELSLLIGLQPLYLCNQY